MTEVVVAARGLTKRYGPLVALDGLDLDIRRGEIFALLGPNGAGKTTFISIVAGLVRRSAGSVTVLGRDVATEPLFTRRAIGLVPQEINFDPFFTVFEILRYQRGYMGLPPDDDKLDELLRALDLHGKRDVRTRALSGGMKRRLLVAKALVHDPAIVFLDEPTAGVDVSLRRDLWDYVRRRRAGGTTFILTTHYLEEAQQLADRVGVIDHGRLLLVDDTARILERLGRRTLDVVLAHPVDELPPALAALGGALDPARARVSFAYKNDDAATVAHLLEAIVASRLPLADVQTTTPNLEKIFVDLIEGSRLP